MEQATFDDFMKLDIRVGTIVEARPFEKARRPAYQPLVDLGSMPRRTWWASRCWRW